MKPLKKLNEGFNNDTKNNQTIHTNTTDMVLSPISTTNNELSVATSQFDGAVECRRIDMRMVQNVRLIWLDSNIDENSIDCHNMLNQLRRTVNTINMYTDSEECIQFLETINKEKVCMIISGSLGQQIVSRVHDMSQVDSVFILCDNKTYHEEWTEEWPKIKGVFTEILSISEALKQTAQQCGQNAISMSFMSTGEDLSKKKLNQLDPSFMYTQILKEILLTIKFEPKHFEEFIQYCRDIFSDNDGELENITKLERNYQTETPIWWYTFNCFLYPMLNRSLRMLDVDIMIKIGFFMNDLYRHIDQLYQEQYGSQNSESNFTVYRGQGMSKTEFDQMNNSNGGLISFNNFLSTSKNRAISLRFANSTVNNPDLVGVLFIMTIDPSQSTTPLASIANASYYKTEDEVLFAMHTVFRINDIKPMAENHRLYQVDLTLTTDNDKDLRALTDIIREETEESTGWHQLGQLLLKIGQPEKAEEVYNILLQQTIEEIEKSHIYNYLGRTKYLLGEYEKAITFYEKSLEISQKTLSPNHPDLAVPYGAIAMAYSAMGEYSKALSYYEKDLEIGQKTLPSSHLNLAISYNNIGQLYEKMGEYTKALSFHEKSLEIKQQSLPPNHPSLAASSDNIGVVYNSMGEYAKALIYFEKSLEIKQQSLPSNHPDLAKPYSNIGSVHGQMGEYAKALPYFEKALEISQKTLPSNHPNLAAYYSNIGATYEEMGEYAKALSFHEKSLEIRQQLLPPNHPDLAVSYILIGNVYLSIGEYSKAILSHEKALEISQKSKGEKADHGIPVSSVSPYRRCILWIAAVSRIRESMRNLHIRNAARIH